LIKKLTAIKPRQMKKLLSLLALLVLTLVGMYGQSPAPGILNYQGVARNSVGNVLVNKTITLRLTLRDNGVAGPLVYQESRTVTTNPFGLFNVQIGSAGATNVTGSIPLVNWGVNSTKFIQVEIDPNGGTSFINIGAAQIASVPYSLYSNVANDLVLPFNKTQADNGSLFRIVNSGNATGSTALEGVTNSGAANAAAIIGIVSGTGPGGFSSGVRGINNGTGGLGIGVYGSQAGSGWGVYGTTPSGRGVYGQSISGEGVYGQSTSGFGLYGTTTSGRALRTDGNIQFTGINEGPPVAPSLYKILGGDATGNASWQHPTAFGLVSGSGTLNFVPKWTPNGTTLGNSQIFDNGTSVGINTTTPNAAYRLEIQGLQRINATTNQEGGELRFQEGNLFGPQNHWIIDNFLSIAGGNKFRIWNDVGGMNLQMLPNGRTAVGNMVFSDQPQSTLDVEGNLAVGTAYSGTTAAPANGAIIEGNVGIGINTPGTRLHVVANAGGAATEIIRNLNNTGFSSAWYQSAAGGTVGHFGYGNPGAGLWANQMFAGSIAAIPFVFTTTDLERMRITPGGYVGIGTTTPTSHFQVQHSAAVDRAATIAQTDVTNTSQAMVVTTARNVIESSFVSTAITAVKGPGAIFGSSSPATIYATSRDAHGMVGASDNGIGVFGIGINGPAMQATSVGTGGGLTVFSLGGGNGIDVLHDQATGFGTRIQRFNAANPTPALQVLNTGSARAGDFLSTTGIAVYGQTNGTTDGLFAMHGVVSPASPGSFSTGVRGQNNGTGGLGIGVWGSQNGSGWGVYGTTPSGISVLGSTGNGVGVWGQADNGWGMRAVSNTNTGIFSTSNSGIGGDFRSATNYAGLFQNTDINNSVRGTILGYNPSREQFARALYLQGSGYSGYFWTARQVAEIQSDSTVGVAIVSRYSNGIQTASETGSGIYSYIFNNTGVGNAAVVAQSTNPNSHGLYGLAPNGGVGRALVTVGPVQLTGINEGTNRVLTSIDNFGNARWQNLAGAGIVGGSGTLNYVPKWTPDGNTLGNSQIFDNGLAVGIGTTTPTPAVQLDLVGTFSQFRLFDTDQASQVWLSAPGLGYTGGVGTLTNHDFPIFTNGLDRVMVKNNGRVGIGTLNPTAFTEIVGNSVVGTPHLKLTENSQDYGRLTFRNIHANNVGNNFWDIAGYNDDNRLNERLNIYNNATGDLVSVTGDGRVGIGTFNPSTRLHVNSGTNFNNVFLEAQTAANEGPHQFFYSGGEFGIIDYIRTDYTNAVLAHRRGALELRGWSRLNMLPTGGADMTTSMTILANGNVGIGTATPIWKTDIHSTLAALRLLDTDDNANIFLLAAGAGYTGGVGTTSNHDLPIFTNNIDRLTVKTLTGDVGIATASPGGRLHLISNPNSRGLISEQSYTTAPAFNTYRYSNAFSSLNTNIGVYSKTGAPINTNIPPALYTGFLGFDSTNSAISAGVSGISGNNSNTGTGVYGIGSKTYNPSLVGQVFGFIGGTFLGGDAGVAAGVWNDTPGMDMEGNGINEDKIGLFAFVSTVAHAGNNYGIYSRTNLSGAANYAGYFQGNVEVNGNFSATGAKAFKIDHPLDPENKYLVHAAVESPEMMNIYNGNIVTDANGRAIVQLPAYFDAANKEFKYQLTIVDETQFAMARISKKVNGNSFEIMTDKPGIEVSWQVTGVRKDVAAEKYRFNAEQEKKGKEKGKYLTPELYGLPADKGIHYQGDKLVVADKESKAPLVPVTIISPKEKAIPAPVLDERAVTSNKETEAIQKTWAKPIDKPKPTQEVPEVGSDAGKPVILSEQMLPKQPVKQPVVAETVTAAPKVNMPLPPAGNPLQKGTAPDLKGTEQPAGKMPNGSAGQSVMVPAIPTGKPVAKETGPTMPTNNPGGVVKEPVTKPDAQPKNPDGTKEPTNDLPLPAATSKETKLPVVDKTLTPVKSN
jgi:hypothetical protein